MRFNCYYLYCTKLIICNDIINIIVPIVTPYDIAKLIVDKYINATLIILYISMKSNYYYQYCIQFIYILC